MQPDSVMSINAVEAYTMDSFSADNVRNAITEAQKAANSSSEFDAAEAKIELEVCAT